VRKPSDLRGRRNRSPGDILLCPDIVSTVGHVAGSHRACTA
jgi:hypothetical protein